MSAEVVTEALDAWQARADHSLQLPPLMTRKEVAEFFNVCVETVRYWEKRGYLSAHRYGHSTVRIERQSVLDFMRSRKTR